VISKYGDDIRNNIVKKTIKKGPRTAVTIFNGPYLVFDSITKKYKIDTILEDSFGKQLALKILSLTWYIVSEGKPLSNSETWLEFYENPNGGSISSQEISRLLKNMDYDSILTFYKLWFNMIRPIGDKVLYDLTSISYLGTSLDLASWGHNRDDEKFPQVNFALLCLRSSGIPLFSWVLDGSINDIKTLETTIQFLKNFDYTPNCLILDRGFSASENITYLLENNITFLQALKLNANWMKEIIDKKKRSLLLPGRRIKIKNRSYYSISVVCKWIVLGTKQKSGKIKKSIIVLPENDIYECKKKNTSIIGQYNCTLHIFFCPDLVTNYWDILMGTLSDEYDRLIETDSTDVAKDLKKYFIISKDDNGHVAIDYNNDLIPTEINSYSGYLCFLSNDKTIESGKDILREYSTRDAIEKDFDEMKNDLDMGRIRVHDETRMKSRLFIQFLAEIYLRDLRMELGKSKECEKLNKDEIMSCIKTIHKIKFESGIKDIVAPLSKRQRDVLTALKIIPL
jgi:transposase